jgi:uncharacterized membrane protein YdjX (TVP38/TMEM64 family)
VPADSSRRGLSGASRWFVLAAIVAAALSVYWFAGDKLSLQSLAAQEATLRQYQTDSFWLTIGIALVIYVLVTGLSIPGAAPLTLVYGWLFGVVGGVLLVSFASTTGATIAFLISRYVFRDSIAQRFDTQLKTFNEAMERESGFYLFALRLIPVVPFFVINLVMGLTPIRMRTFWWVSQLGMLPGTIAYIVAGASVPSLAELSSQGVTGILTPRTIAAFAVLGILPLLMKFLLQWVRAGRRPPASAARSSDG